MRNYLEAKKEYLANHLARPLKQPQRRINALAAIENTIAQNDSELLKTNTLFTKFDKEKFSQQYSQWKGKAPSGAEKAVITGLYKYAQV